MKKLAPIVLALLRPASALPTHRRIPDVLERVKQQRQQWDEPELQLAQEGEDAAGGDVETSFYDQRLDHFSEEDEDEEGGGGGHVVTFRQRYFYTSRYVHEGNESDDENEEDGPLAFLCVGGEGPSLDSFVLVDSVHCTGDMIAAAERLHREEGRDVHLFALEHRYYGMSVPPSQNDDRVGYLRGEEEGEDTFEVDYAHLSSRQAVRDIVRFVQSPEILSRLNPPMDSGGKTPPPPTWIAFGASYPGMLSAWSRLLHPGIISAAVSNSAPVEARLDFEGYNDRKGADLSDEFVGGSELCERVVRQGHEEVVSALEEDEGYPAGEDGIDRVAALFNVCGGAEKLRSSRRNMEAFVGDGVISTPAQSNDPSCTAKMCNIKGLCDTIVDDRETYPGSSPMETLARVRKLQSYGCVNADWKAFLDYLGTPTRQNANDRTWMYQTCSEFGFYQTCNRGSGCPYGKGYHDVSQDLEMCRVVFGIAPDEVRKNVESTLAYYGGWSLTPAAAGGDREVGPGGIPGDRRGAAPDGRERLLFATGDVDPWSELAVRGPGGNSVSVKGSSHHFWTHEIRAGDGDEIAAARQTIYEAVSGWVGAPARPRLVGPGAAVETE